jgi:PAS domain S-box-containing protein
MTGDHRTVVSLQRFRRPESGQQGRARVRARHLAALAAIVLLHPIAAPMTKETRGILTLSEAGTSYAAISIVNQGTQTALRNSLYQLEFYSEYLDTILFPDLAAALRELWDFHLHKYQYRKPDVTISDGPSSLKFVQEAHDYMFNWQPLKRRGLNQKELLPGSIVINRQPRIWSLYRWYFLGSVGLVLVQTLMIFGLLWHRSELRKSEKALRESEERFHLVADTAPVMIWMSGPDRLRNYVNKTWLDFTGRPLEAGVGGWAEEVHPDDSNRCLQTYTEAFDRRESFETQYRLRRHDGEYRWVLDKGVPRFNPEHAFAGYIGSCIDITDRKLAEESLATIGRRLIEAHEEERIWIGRELHDDINQRLALLAVELGGWGHRIPPANQFVAQVFNTQRRITEIAKDVQGLSHRLHSSKLEYLGLATAAKSFCREMSEQSKVEVQFTQTDIPRNLPKEISLCLFRVLQEALQNAVKHSGVRSFTVDLHGTEEAIELTVGDTGRGFEEQEAFTRPGLGLISMRERLQMVRGELEVKSKPGAGTKIYARVAIKMQSYRAVAG